MACRELESGRVLWYNSKSKEIVFDTHPLKPVDSAAEENKNSAANIVTAPLSRFARSATLTKVPREIDPQWEVSSDGSWYNKLTFETRESTDPPYLDLFGSLDEEIVYNDTPISAAIRLLNFESLHWSFENERVEIYRARASKVL